MVIEKERHLAIVVCEPILHTSFYLFENSVEHILVAALLSYAAYLYEPVEQLTVIIRVGPVLQSVIVYNLIHQPVHLFLTESGSRILRSRQSGQHAMKGESGAELLCAHHLHCAAHGGICAAFKCYRILKMRPVMGQHTQKWRVVVALLHVGYHLIRCNNLARGGVIFKVCLSVFRKYKCVFCPVVGCCCGIHALRQHHRCKIVLSVERRSGGASVQLPRRACRGIYRV